ncbi:hypothetical protein PILCRDRAFT_61377 [Piloderma croceum F 1598]|uniref:G domain-containing protein n=1 Tax=Piloderma croceum (strain F 1598) TaxID=765440 RepID=A0A0C3GCG4_PILCF|nr:hypothetical protein PILCRDRAFT_61377 [Piloderma croceum F 1598]
MLLGSDAAKISSGALGCTFESMAYNASIGGSPIKLYDTSGLNEGTKGAVPAKTAIINLYKLIRNMDSGVSLLVYCIRGPRIEDTTVNNYKMFYEAFCQKNVPIVVVINGLENEENLDDWWGANKEVFESYGMHFAGHACVVSTKGKKKDTGKYSFEEEYEESRKTVQKLIGDHQLGIPWRMERNIWFVTVVKSAWNWLALLFGLPKVVLSSVLYFALRMTGITEEEALETTNSVERELK